MLIRKTKSVCPVCIRNISASIVKEKNKIYMKKFCNKHGKFNVLLSNDANYYLKLHDSYFSLNISNYQYSKYKKNYFNIYLTLKCNLNCPICLTRANIDSCKEPSLIELKNILKNKKNFKIGLWGGEPTLRQDLPEIIQLVKKSGNFSALYTNGIRISNFKYLKKLVENGLDIVHLQFDGFDDVAYKKLRGKNLLTIKLKALNNLKKLNVPVVLETTFAKGLNENEMIKIFNYALKNKFIKSILFRSYSHIGRAGLSKDVEIVGDDLVELFSLQTNYRISKSKIIDFQNFLHIFYDIVKTRRCYYNQYILIIRGKNNYKIINDYFNIKHLQKYIYNYNRINNKFIRNIYFFINFPIRLINLNNLFLLPQVLSVYIQRVFLKKSFTSANLSSKMLILGFGCICNAYNYDIQSAKFCSGGEISLEEGIISSLIKSNLLREKKFYNYSN